VAATPRGRPARRLEFLDNGINNALQFVSSQPSVVSSRQSSIVSHGRPEGLHDTGRSADL
jgi:hypothetical protein